eukprot:6174767-Pleurochrysis_carterae.AAC.3
MYIPFWTAARQSHCFRARRRASLARRAVRAAGALACSCRRNSSTTEAYLRQHYRRSSCKVREVPLKSARVVESRSTGLENAGSNSMTAPVATASFLLAADDVLAHLQFLPVAFIGKEACSWEYGSRHFLLQVTAMGEYIVSIGPSVLPVTSPTDTPASNTYANEEAGDGNGSLPDEAAMKAAAASPYSVIVAPFDDMPDELKPSEIACRIACTPEALLTCLAGAPAELLASDVGAMQQFLSAFRFDGCECRLH